MWYPCLDVMIQKHLNSWPFGGTGCFFLIFFWIQFGNPLKPLSPQAQHPHMSPHHAKAAAEMRGRAPSAHPGPPQPGFPRSPLRNAFPGPRHGLGRLAALSTRTAVYSGLAIKINPPFSFLIYYPHGSIHFCTTLLSFQWGFRRQQGQCTMFKTVT